VPEPLFAIVNPAAAGGRCGARFARWRAKDGADFDLEVVFTEGPRHAREIAEKARSAGRRRLLSVGGDGTLFEVVNGLLPGTGAGPVDLAVLPLGTGNSFSRDLGIESLEDASRALARE